MTLRPSRLLRTLLLVGLFLVAASGWVIRPGLIRELRGERTADEVLIDNVLAIIRQHYADSLGEHDLRLRAVEGILRNLPDNYSSLLVDGELRGYRDLLEGTAGDVGLRLLDGPLGLTVEEITAGSPAALEDIREGDRILSIEGAPTLGWSSLRGEQALRGEPGSSVRVRLRHPGQAEIETQVLKRERAQRLAPTTRTLGPGVVYVRLASLSRGSAATITDALTRLVADGAQAVVLDLRNNPGGLLEEATSLLDHFLDAGTTIGVVQGRNTTRDQRIVSNARQRWPGLKVVVLVNEATASAAEIIAAGLQENHRGIVLGEHTFGKGMVQSTVKLGPKLAVRISTARWITPAGHALDRSPGARGGVEPDLVVPPWHPSADELAFARAIGARADAFRQILEGVVARGEWIPAPVPGDSLAARPAAFAKLGQHLRAGGFAYSARELARVEGLLRQEYAVLLAARGSILPEAQRKQPGLPDAQLRAAVKLLQGEAAVGAEAGTR